MLSTQSTSEQKRTLPKKNPRILRSFAPSRAVGGTKGKSQPLVPGMSCGDSQDIDMDARTANPPCNLSFSTSAASQKKVPKNFDIFLKLLDLRNSWTILNRSSCYWDLRVNSLRKVDKKLGRIFVLNLREAILDFSFFSKNSGFLSNLALIPQNIFDFLEKLFCHLQNVFYP